MTDWKGSFLRKHVVNIVLTDEKPEGKGVGVEAGPEGYFVVTFDQGESGVTQHNDGTYVYPASKEMARRFREGELDPKEFYGW